MSQASHIPRFTLERWLAGELGDRQDIQGHLETCSHCTARLDGLRADRSAFAQEVPYAEFRIEHEERVTRRIKTTRRRLWLLAPLAAATAAALVLIAIPTEPPPTERVKGAGVALTLFGAEGTPLAPGSAQAPGNRIQLAYDAGKHPFLALVGIDASGEVSTYFPEHGTRLAPLPAGEEGLFPFGLELDQTGGIERFFLVLADRPESLAPVMDAARAIANTDLRATDRLPLPPGYAQATVWLQKPEGP